MIDTGEGYLTQAASASTPVNEAFALVGYANRLGNLGYDLLQRLEGSGADQIPHQVVGPFQRWVDGLGIQNTIFFRADHVANYELATFRDLEALARNLNNPSQSLLDATAEITWPFLRLTVPSQAMGMLPHFAIVGHELGHAIQDRITPDLNSYAGADQDSIQRTNTRLIKEGLAFGAAEQLQRQAILNSWMNEIISDAVGYYLAGPAFFFALAAFFELSGGAWGIGPSHPPSVLRRKLVLEKLRAGKRSHAAVFETATGLRIQDDMNSPHLMPLPPPDDVYAALPMGRVPAAICVELVPLFEVISGAFYSEAERVLHASSPEMVYTSERLRADLANHLEPLCQLIPPIEHREAGVPKAASLAGILNVGWAALLAKLDQLPQATVSRGVDDVAPKMEKLHELLLKAVELSHARRTWEEH